MVKPRIIFLGLLLFSISYNLHSQDISNEEKTKILSYLDSTSVVNLFDRGWALDKIVEYKISEAIPKLLERIWEDNVVIKSKYLKTLYELEYYDIHNIALRFIDSTAFLKDSTYYSSPLQLKVEATEILFKLDDYSTTKYIFDLLDRGKIKNDVDITSLMLLPEIIKNVPAYRDRAISELARIAFTYNDDYSIKNRALIYINELFGHEYSDQIRDLIKSSSTDRTTRSYCLKILEDNNYSGLREFLLNQIPQEQDVIFKYEMTKILLRKSGLISDYNFIKEYSNLVTDPILKDVINFELKAFEVQMPNYTTSILEMLDSLTTLTNKSYNYFWLKDATYHDELISLSQSARNYLSSSDSINCAKQIKSFQSSIQNVYADSAGSYPNYVSDDAYKFLYYYPQYILDRLPSIPTIKLKDSQGNLLPGGSLQYYEGGWKNAMDNGDGTFTIETQLKTVSLRMTYEYGSQTKSNVTVGADTVVFQTVNTAVKLQDSQDNLIPAPMGDQGTVQYYAGGWRNFGTTTSGIAYKELLPVNYTFRMSYGYASNDKAQNLDTNSTVIFKTVNASVQLKDSQGNLITESSTIQYYSGGWRQFGSTENGVVLKELLPNNYMFRMSYGFASNDKQQNIGINSLVEFQTVNAELQLRDSQNNLLDQGTVQYYSGGWRQFGVTTNGIVNKELLPNNYTFRMNYGFASNDKQQNLNTNPTVVFQTVNSTVQLKDSQGNLIDQGTVQYYSGGWREFGTTSNGMANKELLPNNYTFRMNYAFASKDKQQNIGTNPLVEFQTVNAVVQLRDSQNNLIDQGAVQYYSGGWREFGTTLNGVVNKELLANNYTFRMNYGFASNDKAQDLNTNTTVVFQTVNIVVELRNSTGNLIDQGVVQYYSGGWRNFGTTNGGISSKELLPNNYTFRMTHEFISNDKSQNTGTNNTISFSTVLCTVRVRDAQNQPVDNATASYYSGGWRQLGTTVNGEVTKELLPANLTLRINYGGIQQDKTQNLSISNIIDFIIGQ